MTLSDAQMLEFHDKDRLAELGFDALLHLHEQVSHRHARLKTELERTPYNKDDNTAREHLVARVFPLGYLRDALEVKLARDAIIGMLLSEGITHAVAEYDGYGDEGWFRTAEFWIGDPEGRKADLSYNAEYSHGSEEAAPADSAAAFFIDYAMELLNIYHPGYENNDGGQGEVIFDAAEGIRIEHGYNVTVTEEEVTRL
jgi:hypothetical protein